MSQRKRAWRTFSRNRSALVGLVLVILLVLIAIFAPLIAPHNPLSQSTMDPFAGAVQQTWLGRDPYGRDVFSRIIYGTRVALQVGILSVLLGGICRNLDRRHRRLFRRQDQGAADATGRCFALLS